jgi:hypothetical protein
MAQDLAKAADRVRGLKVVILFWHFFGCVEQDVLYSTVGGPIESAERIILRKNDDWNKKANQKYS